MNEKVRKVLNGYLSLSDQEKLELVRNVTTHSEKPKAVQEKEENEVRRLGPTSTYACPCCGK